MTCRIKILTNAGNEMSSGRYFEETIICEQFRYAAEGRVIEFLGDEHDGHYQVIAVYPTSNTIIEEVER